MTSSRCAFRPRRPWPCWVFRCGDFSSAPLGYRQLGRLAIGSVSHQIEERAVNAGIFTQLRVKSGSHGLALPHDHGILPFRREHFDPRSHALDPGSANEDHFDRRVAEKTFADGAIDLTPVSVAPNPNIDRAQPRLPRVL